MQKRGARLTLVALLVAAGAAAATLLWDIDRRTRALDSADAEVARRVEAMTAAVVDLGLAQHGYIALGDSVTPYSIVRGLVRLIDDNAKALQPLAQAPGTAATLRAIADAVSSVEDIDRRAREYAAAGQTFLAADLLFGEAREQLATLATRLRELRAAEAEAALATRAGLRDEALAAVGTATALWLVGLLILALAPVGRAGTSAAPAPPLPEKRPEGRPDDARPSMTVDLKGAAAVCTDLGRLTSSAALPGLLARAAASIGARGLILWMGAGDQLFPAMAHGYDARIVARLAPIDRHDANATAQAWRTGRLRTVAGGTGTHGAIVAPLFGPTQCIGVLAAEVAAGRENDPAIGAVTAMLAAQLAAVVAAWPPASTGADQDRAAGAAGV